jgi:hypothetical protein
MNPSFGVDAGGMPPGRCIRWRRVRGTLENWRGLDGWCGLGDVRQSASPACVGLTPEYEQSCRWLVWCRMRLDKLPTFGIFAVEKPLNCRFEILATVDIR